MHPLQWAAVAVLAVGALEWLLVWARWPWLYRWAFPLGMEPLPIHNAPEGTGRTTSVVWEVRGAEVLFWALPGAGGNGLPFLRGVVTVIPDRERYRLYVRWTPPWTLLAFVLALAVAGTVLGAGYAAVPTAVVLGTAGVVAYQQAAVRATGELRWAFQREE